MKKTTPQIAEIAAQILQNQNSSKIQARLAGSILSQTNTANRTSHNMASVASDVMRSEKYSTTTKKMAASALAQA